MKPAALLLLAASARCAQTKQPDLGVWPPSGVAPSLPAKLMTGPGVVHFPAQVGLRAALDREHKTEAAGF